MIGRLTKYELKKILGSKFFALALVLLLVLNMALCFREEGEWTYFGQPRKAYASMQGTYDTLADLSPEEKEAFRQAMLDKYGENAFGFDPDAMDKMNETPDYFGTELGDLTYVISYQEVQRIQETMDSTLQGVVSAARANGKTALQENDSYNVRRNLEIIRLYSLPRQTVRTPVRSWNTYLFNTHTMVFALLMIFYVCAGVFSKEIDSQSWLLLQTSKNGRGKTMAAKYIAAGIMGAVLTVLFFGSSLVMIYANLGLPGMNESISQVQGMELFPYPITVWQYALVSLACQVFAGVIMALILSALSAFCKNSVISYGVGLLTVAGSVVLSFFPPKSLWLSGPLALSQSWKLLDTFRTANIFGYPVLWVIVEAVLWAVLAGVLVAFSHRVYHRKRSKI